MFLSIQGTYNFLKRSEWAEPARAQYALPRKEEKRPKVPTA